MVAEFLTIDVLTALAITVAAGLMRGFAGVGSGMLMAPFFVVLFGPVQTIRLHPRHNPLALVGKFSATQSRSPICASDRQEYRETPKPMV